MKRRITILAVTAAIMIGAIAATQRADSAQAAHRFEAEEQMLGSTWS